jgi:hypothetical protein
MPLCAGPIAVFFFLPSGSQNLSANTVAAYHRERAKPENKTGGFFRRSAVGVKVDVTSEALATVALRLVEQLPEG